MPRFVCDICSYTVWQSLVWNECPGPGCGTLQRAKRNESWVKCSRVWTAVTCCSVIPSVKHGRFIHKTSLLNRDPSPSSVLIWPTATEFSQMFRLSRVVVCISRLPLCTTRAVRLILLDFVTLQHCWKTALLKFITSFSPTSCYCPPFGHQPCFLSSLHSSLR